MTVSFHRPPENAAVSDEDLETALVTMAYLVLRHGEVLAPLLEKLERESEYRKSEDSPMAKARRILEQAAARAVDITPPSRRAAGAGRLVRLGQ
jgi:hypothetical protein